MKRVVSKLIGWYHVWLVQQVTALGATITHALRLLGQRVDTVERLTGDAERAVRAAGARMRRRAPTTYGARPWSTAFTADRAGSLVAECGGGALLARS